MEGSWLAVGGRKSNWSGWPLRRSARAAIEATFVLVLGVGVVWFTRKVVGVQDGTVLVFLVIVPALVYLVLRGDLAELRGPGGPTDPRETSPATSIRSTPSHAPGRSHAGRSSPQADWSTRLTR